MRRREKRPRDVLAITSLGSSMAAGPEWGWRMEESSKKEVGDGAEKVAGIGQCLDWHQR